MNLLNYCVFVETIKKKQKQITKYWETLKEQTILLGRRKNLLVETLG